MNELNINLESDQNKDLLKNKKIILKAINLIDDFVTKFISKVEYYKMNLESKLNNVQSELINRSLSAKQNVKEFNLNNKEESYINNNNQNNSNNNEEDYLNKFINSKNFYKRAINLLFLISEDKSQIQKLIKIDANNININKESKFSCIKEINTKNFINSICFLKNENMIAFGMYNFFDGSSIDLYSLDLKIKLSIKKLGSNIHELETGELLTCSYNSINIIKIETHNEDFFKYKVLQTLKGKSDSGEILGVLEFDSILISYDWNHILIWKKIIQNKNKKKNDTQLLKFKEFKSSNYGCDYLLKINNNEFISHEKGNIIAFYSLDNFNIEDRAIIKNLHSIGDSMCLIDDSQLLIIGGNENGLLYIISIIKKEIINSIKINDIKNYSINKILFYVNNEKMNLLCGGGYNLTDKEVTSDLINISFNINKNSKDIINIEEKNVFKNAHNSWITGLLIENNFENKIRENKNNFFKDIFFNKSNILKNVIIFFSTSHDKKIKIWKENNDSLI